MTDGQGAGSQWRPVCFTVQSDDKADASGIKQWLQSKQNVQVLDLSDQGFASATGPIAEALTAAKEAAAKAGADFELSPAVKAAAVQQAFQADKATALTSEHEARVKREADAAAAFKAAEEEATRTSAEQVLAAGRASEAAADNAEDPALTAATKAYDAAKVALLKARQAHQAAHASLQQPCLLQQPYWCDGAGADAPALAGWQQAGLPLRAVVYLKTPTEGAEGAVPPLIAELRATQQQCDPTNPLADLAILELNVGEPNSLFTPIKTPQIEDPKPAADPAAAAAKGSAKAPAAKGPPAKAPAAAKAAAAAVEQAPAAGAPELGRALELLGLQVQEYYSWREGATVIGLPAEQTNSDDLACLTAALNGTVQEQASTSTILDAMLQQLSHSPSPQSTSLTAADTFSNVVGGSHVAAHSNASEPIEPSSAVTTSCVVYEGDLRSAADTGMLTGYSPGKRAHKGKTTSQSGTRTRISSLQDLDLPMALIRARKAGPSQAALQAAGAARTALRAQCTEVSLETVERYNLLRKFLAMLPASQQSTHDAAVMARQHVEYLDATVMAQSLSKAAGSCPGLHVQEYAEEGALLVACYGGVAEDSSGTVLECLQPFSEVWNAFVASGAQVLALQQQPVKQLTCTSAAGAVICCTVKPPIEGPDKPREISVQCTSPSGIVTELTADGQIILADSSRHNGPVPSGRGVATHGAPLDDGDIEGLLKDNQPSWRSVLSTGEVTQAFESGRVRILSPDGSIREHWPSGFPDAPIKTAAAWVRTNPTGQRWLQYDDESGAAPQRSESASTAEVSAAGGSAAVPSQEPKPQAAIPGEGKTALPSETQPPSVDPPSAAETAPAVPQGPQSLPSLHSATVTDPESGAQVTTRSDLMMVIDYVTGDRVIQDSDRTRVTSYASGGFMVESAGLPTIAGTAAGVVLEPLPGLTMQWASTDRSIQVNLNQVAQLACLGNVAAFLNSELAMGQATGSALSVSQLCKAVATANMTKAAEIAKQMAQSQKELDIQNAAAAEQHVNDMAEHEAKIAEAAAAWEAERKKKKGKAKDEAAPAPPLAPVAPTPQMAQPPRDPMGLADTVAAAAPGWFAFDLQSGSMAYQDAAQAGSHITFSGDQQLTGWQPATAPSLAMGLRPRLFVVYQDGSGYEVLDNDVFAAYAWRQSQNPQCRVTESDVINAPEPDTRSISFMTRHELKGPDVPELPLAEVRLVQEAAPPAAVPALQPPSQVALPSMQQTLVMPRVAAFTPQQSRATSSAPTYSFRQITKFPAFMPDTLDGITAALRAFTALQMKQSQALPSTYTLTDSRSPEEQSSAAELSSRLARLRAEHQSSAALQTQQLPVRDTDKSATAPEQVQKPVKQKKPRTPKVGPYDNTKRAPVKGSTLGYWEAEEGFKAADHMRQHPSQHQLPPLQDRKHPSRDVGVAAEDKAEGLVQETSVADSSTVQEDDVGYADVQGDGVSVAEDVDIPSLQLGESSNQGMAELDNVQGSRQQPASPSRSTVIRDVYGRIRPAAAASNEAAAGRNLPYIHANEDALNMTRTSSASLMHMQGKTTKQFMLAPGHLDFGSVKLGQAVEKTARLLNVSLERARFTVHRPRPPLQVSCATGPVAAGMHTTIKVTFTGQTLGDFAGSLHLTSELNTFSVSVSARVVPAVSSLESQDSMFPALSLGAASRLSLGNVSRGSLGAISRSSLAPSPDVKPQ